MHRYLGTRNKLAVIKKNFGKMKFLEVLTRETFLVTPLYLALYTLRGFNLIFAHFEGIRDALKDRNKNIL